jgi:hypothetical protein
MNKLTVNKEHAKGYASGMRHDHTSALYNDNLRKMGEAINDKYCPPLVKAYWEGYKQGLAKQAIA